MKLGTDFEEDEAHSGAGSESSSIGEGEDVPVKLVGEDDPTFPSSVALELSTFEVADSILKGRVRQLEMVVSNGESVHILDDCLER